MIDYLDFHECFIDQTSKGSKIKRSDYLEFGDFPIIDQGKALIGGYTNNNALIFKGEYPCVLFGDHSKEIKYVDFQFCLGADGVKVLKCTNRILPKYGYYFLRTIILPETGYERNFKHLKRIKIPVIDLKTQQKIVAVLDKTQNLIRKREQSIQLLDDLLKSTFLEMFGDPFNNPKKFKIGTIRDLVENVKYGTSSKASQEGELPYLRMNNLTYNGYLDLSELKYITLPQTERAKYIVSNGDILFNRTNSRELVGKTVVYDLDTEMVIAGYIVKSRANKKANPYFIWGYLNSEHGKLKLRNMCKSIVGMANINAQEFQDIPIQLPPSKLQNEFGAIVQNVIKSKTQLQYALKQENDLFQSLLQDAFAGKLRFNKGTVELQTALEKLHWLEEQTKQITRNLAVAKLQTHMDAIKKLSPSITAAEYLNQIQKAIPKFQFIDEFKTKLVAKYNISGLDQIRSEVLLKQIQSEKLIRALTGNQPFGLKSYEEYLESEELKIREEELKRENDPAIRFISEQGFGKKFQQTYNLNLAKFIYESFGKAEFNIQEIKNLLNRQYSLKINEKIIISGIWEIIRDFIIYEFGGLFSFNEMRQKLKESLFNPSFDLLKQLIDINLEINRIEQVFIDNSIEVDGKNESHSWLTSSLKIVPIKESRIYLQLKNETD
jgi:type I restriction enzyme, S subunit